MIGGSKMRTCDVCQKTLGVFNIEIKLYEGVVGKLKIDVISE